MKSWHDVDETSLIDWARSFVRSPSEQTSLLERDPAVLAFIRDTIRPLVASHGLAGTMDEFGNLAVVAGPDDAPLELAIFTYAMTHPASSMRAPFAGELIERPEGVALRGRGVSEQKAAMAASLAAVVDIARSGATLRRFAWLALTAGETGRHDAIAHALAALGEMPRRAIVAVGTNSRISIGNRGRLDVEVVIRGRPAHSSTPWLGVDVVPAIREVLVKTDALDRTLPSHPVLGPASLTCTSIRTWPEATHTIQSEARLVLDRRLLPGEDPEHVFAELDDALARSGEPSVTLAKGPLMYPSELTEDHAFVSEIAAALAAANLAPPDCFHAQGALDAGYLQARGVSAVMWGPGDSRQFHTDEEMVLVQEMSGMTRCYRALLYHLCAK